VIWDRWRWQPRLDERLVGCSSGNSARIVNLDVLVDTEIIRIGCGNDENGIGNMHRLRKRPGCKLFKGFQGNGLRAWCPEETLRLVWGGFSHARRE
jgi:hypothetical protein